MNEKIIAVSSCQFPADYFRHRIAYRSIEEIFHLFNEGQNRPRYCALIITGDIIYSDATAGVFDPVDPNERYAQQYRQFKLNTPWLDPIASKKIVSLDDHEIIDDWAPIADCNPDDALKRQYEEYRRDAVKAFLDFTKQPETYYADKCDDLDVFVMDTRSERMARTTQTVSTAKMFSDQQRDCLFKWVSSIADKEKDLVNVPPKFIVSGSMLLPRIKETAELGNSKVAGLRSDGWDGFPASQYEVLQHITECGLRNVIFLSGDAHIPNICFAKARSSSGNEIEFVSIHGSALYAPLPFANGIKEDFVQSESFKLYPATADAGTESTNHLSIDYRTEFPDCGDGFALLEIANNAGQYTATVRFAGCNNNYEPSDTYPL